ncbi:hypothetical protein FEK35_24270 [Nocardia cyriacigeorgica]|uniref:Uncharacterized protein n=1 Tax=Nocardia cyriacigeorgica TaxID=135487 RepID=A0A5R8P832_9NOCA|nr:hypothetical protein [Nocardia cyriacigeorgica]TLG00360.1 hypothetical protein FEK35_24270 [Nocardia cyriacigeorgica]
MEASPGGGAVVTAHFAISAVGAFVRPKADVGISGASSFRGKVLRPSSWDDDYDLTGKRVGIIGTGASAVQIDPSIAPQVEQLTVFQRTPVWVLPKPDFQVPRALHRVLAIPGCSRCCTAVRWWSSTSLCAPSSAYREPSCTR